jgi:hypothetical protein
VLIITTILNENIDKQSIDLIPSHLSTADAYFSRVPLRSLSINDLKSNENCLGCAIVSGNKDLYPVKRGR